MGKNLLLIKRIKEALRKHRDIIDVKHNEYKEIREMSLALRNNEERIKLDFSQMDFSSYSGLDNIELRGILIDTDKLSIQNLYSFKQTHSKIDHITILSFQNLKKLDISQNLIEKIDDTSFVEINRLEDLNMSSNRISNIPENLFSNLKCLARLDLSDNYIKEIRRNTFNGLSNLKELYIHDQNEEMEFIDRHAYDQLSSLKKLKTSTSKSEQLNELYLYGLTNLEYLEISCNKDKLEYIDENNLKTIRINSNKTRTKYSQSFFACFNQLEELNLNSAHLDFNEFPPNISQLLKLQLTNVQIDSIYPFIFYLPRLETMNFGWIDSIEPEFFMKNLFDFALLKSIEFNSVEINRLHKNMLNDLKLLTKLNLNNCKLKIIDVDAFKDLTSLKSLNLSLNEIDNLQEGLFNWNLKLKHLDLSSNKLTGLSKSFFQLK